MYMKITKRNPKNLAANMQEPETEPMDLPVIFTFTSSWRMCWGVLMVNSAWEPTETSLMPGPETVTLEGSMDEVVVVVWREVEGGVLCRRWLTASTTSTEVLLELKSGKKRMVLCDILRNRKPNSKYTNKIAEKKRIKYLNLEKMDSAVWYLNK